MPEKKDSKVPQESKKGKLRKIYFLLFILPGLIIVSNTIRLGFQFEEMSKISDPLIALIFFIFFLYLGVFLLSIGLIISIIYYWKKSQINNKRKTLSSGIRIGFLVTIGIMAILLWFFKDYIFFISITVSIFSFFIFSFTLLLIGIPIGILISILIYRIKNKRLTKKR